MARRKRRRPPWWERRRYKQGDDRVLRRGDAWPFPTQDPPTREGNRGRGGSYDDEDTEFEAMVGNVQGGWSRTWKYKDKKGRWVTDRIYGTGKAGF